MCETCGCDSGTSVKITVPGQDYEHTHDHHHDREVQLGQDVLHHNNHIAERNRGYFEAKKILAINLVSSPGSGKTTLLEKTLRMVPEIPIYVIEGDQQTMNDANRIKATGAPVVQVNTGNGCHLDADMIHRALHQLNPSDESIVIIENVGNLVCPSLFDLGEAKRVVIMSVPEGDDKPLKYPNMFATSQLCIINKTDLLPYVEFDVKKAKEYAHQVNPRIRFIELSATKEKGLKQWFSWLKEHFPVSHI